MLGASLMTRLAQRPENFEVFGTHRPDAILPDVPGATFLELNDIFDAERMTQIMDDHSIDMVINAIGLIKQVGSSVTDEDFIRINSLLPHQVARLASNVGARFLEISTDCTFSGKKGMYTEADTPDATDMYGRSKLLGEVTARDNSLTIRTSIIGHESGRAASLIDWFLSTEGAVKGFRKAIFSGFPTIVLADVIADHIIPNPELTGLYHVSAEPIDKYTLLSMVAEQYGHDVMIEPSDDLVIDRSLDSTRFRSATGFQPLPWPQLVAAMRDNAPKWTSR